MRLTILVAILTLLNLSLISQKNWIKTDDLKINGSKGIVYMPLPNSYFAATLNLVKLKQEIFQEFTTFIDLPYPDGSILRFEIEESQSMESGLASKYPSIKTYKGINTKTGDVVYIDLNSTEFHASIRSVKGEIYIDPYNNEGIYLSYFTKDEISSQENLSCGTLNSELKNIIPNRNSNASRAEGEDLHVFRLITMIY